MNMFDVLKVELLGYHMMKKLCQYVKPFFI